MSGATRPVYARLLRLRHLQLRPLTAFLFFEGSVVVAALLALAELIDWWGVLVIPATVAAMVKLNDVVAGAAKPRPAATRPTEPPPAPPPAPPTAPTAGAPASDRGVAIGRVRMPRAAPVSPDD